MNDSQEVNNSRLITLIILSVFCFLVLTPSANNAYAQTDICAEPSDTVETAQEPMNVEELTIFISCMMGQLSTAAAVEAKEHRADVIVRGITDIPSSSCSCADLFLQCGGGGGLPGPILTTVDPITSNVSATSNSCSCSNFKNACGGGTTVGVPGSVLHTSPVEEIKEIDGGLTTFVPKGQIRFVNKDENLRLEFVNKDLASEIQKLTPESANIGDMLIVPLNSGSVLEMQVIE